VFKYALVSEIRVIRNYRLKQKRFEFAARDEAEGNAERA